MHLGQCRIELGPGQQREQRRLVNDQAAEHLWPARRGAQNDRSAERVAGDVRRGEPQLVDQACEVVGVFEYGALAGRSLALAVPASIEGKDRNDSASVDVTGSQL